MLGFIFVVHGVWSFQVHMFNSTPAYIARFWNLLLFLSACFAILLGDVIVKKNEIHGRRRSKMARADMFCSQGCENRLCAWQVREQLQVYGHEPRLDPHTELVRVIIHHSSGSHFAWPGCLHCMSFLFARTLHLPARTLPLFVFCQSACVDRYCVPARTCGACAGPLRANTLHLFARAFPVPACVLCLHLVYILICSHDHWGGAPPLNHGRAASTLTTGARQCLLWLTLSSPLASVCTTETLHLSLHTHNTLTCNNPPPHTHTPTRHVSTLDEIVSKFSSQSHAHIPESIPYGGQVYMS